MIKVKIVYRNYKPLHDLYASLKIKPPQDISFIIPRPKKLLRQFYPFYLKFGDNPLVRSIISKAQEIFFDIKDKEDVDVLHFAQIVLKDIPTKPYVIDFEHAISLVNFLELDESIIQTVFQFLNNPLCKGILPFSGAAYRSLRYLFDNLDDEITKKIKVIYPALPNYYVLFKNQVDYSYVSPYPETFSLLFVGNSVYLKGLHELLVAFKYLESKYNDIELYVISDAPEHLKRRFSSERIKYFDPKFSHQDIIRKFYLPCDLFVLPTHADTFGMALLYALSCGTPVLATKQFATPEIIKPGHNGLLVQSNRLHLEDVPLPNRETAKKYHRAGTEEQLLVDGLIQQIEYLYLGRDILAKMSRQAVKDFEPGGKFSIDVRNAKLTCIYKSCLV
jgi:glycosyltransferase involved in cell wall biosynthesis